MTGPDVERVADGVPGVAVGPGGAAAPAVPGQPAGRGQPAGPRPPSDAAGDASLLALVDHLAAFLERSDLTELEVEAGGTGLVLRKPAAIASLGTSAGQAYPADMGQLGSGAAFSATREGPAAGGGSPGTGAGRAEASGPAQPSAAPGGPVTVRAPLTGIFYAAPGPGSPPFVAVGREVVVGQVIGLIEAMKLFNEIKSDHAGRVVRVVAQDGALVKAKQPLIEVEPL
jgi:acetyl-CoA carboxylase biotin carboxyl carrier protein